jgi:hypothetical protein
MQDYSRTEFSFFFVVESHLTVAEGVSSATRLYVSREVEIMKCYIAFAIAGLAWLLAAAPDANAVVCARGYYRSGCAGPHGAVVVRHPYGPRCYWRHGVRVCRW